MKLFSIIGELCYIFRYYRLLPVEDLPGSSLLECEGAGHMVLLERHKQVTAELDDLISLAQGRALR